MIDRNNIVCSDEEFPVHVKLFDHLQFFLKRLNAHLRDDELLQEGSATLLHLLQQCINLCLEHLAYFASATDAEALALCQSVLFLPHVQLGEWVLPKPIFLSKIFVGDGHFHESHFLFLSAILYHFS